MPGREYLQGNAEQQAVGFMAELYGVADKLARGADARPTDLLFIFVGPEPDNYPPARHLKEDVIKLLKPHERLAFQMGQFLMEEFGKDFGWDSSAWELGLDFDHPDVKTFFEESAKVIVGCIDLYRNQGDQTLMALSNAISAHDRTISWVNERYNSPRV